MPFKDLSFSCSYCDKTIFGSAYFFFGPGCNEGFCDRKCAYAWLEDRLRESRQPKKVLELKTRSKKPT